MCNYQINSSNSWITQKKTVTKQELTAFIQTSERKVDVLQRLNSQIIDSMDVDQEIIGTDEYNLFVDVTIVRYKDIKESKSITDQQTMRESNVYIQNVSYMQNTQTTRTSN